MLLLYLAYIMAICAANYSVFIFGPSSIPINAFLLIGFDFFIRDFIHERVGIRKVLVLIVISGVICFILNPDSGAIAIASTLSFFFAAITDAIVYQLLILRDWKIKCNTSNFFGAIVDSALFQLIAFGELTVSIFILQLLAKTFGGFVWSAILNKAKT